MMALDEETRELVARALAEDIGASDITSAAVIPEEAEARGSINQHEPGVLYGFDVAREVFRQAGAANFEPLVEEGRWRDDFGPIARAQGLARGVLAGERVALNLLGHLSGIATLTACFVRAVEGTGARILDTRKTTPGLRRLEKAAVVAGGGQNHRMGLHDAILIKDNHLVIAEGVEEAVRRARRAAPRVEIEVECADLSEVEEAIAAGTDRILLDNMDASQIRQAVAMRGERREPPLEASGGVTLENVAEIASTGVEFISVGALTHSAPSLDFGMELTYARWGTTIYGRTEGPE